jgi:hypothetical protein
MVARKAKEKTRNFVNFTSRGTIVVVERTKYDVVRIYF